MPRRTKHNRVSSADSNAKSITSLINIAVWLTGVLVSLAVGFGMVDETLSVKFVPVVITIWAGWVVVILTLLSVILAIYERL